MSVYITGVVVMENVDLYNIIVRIDFVKLILFDLFVMFSYNLDIIGVIFYFIPSFHFIVYYFIIFLFPDGYITSEPNK